MPPPRSLIRSEYSPPRRVQRVKRSYSRRRKIQVLLFLENHRIPHQGYYPNQLQDAGPIEEGFRRPSLRETAAYFGIKHISTIQYWWSRRKEIIGKRSRRYRPKWPLLEVKLYEEFCELRSARRLVQHTWFRRRSKAMFTDLYPECRDIFVFSNGWFRGFMRRMQITRRRVTHASTILPEDVVLSVNDFLQFIRRNSRDHSWRSVTLNSDLGQNTLRRFPLHLIVNLDETPLPFEFLNGYTYDHRGVKSVQGKAARSGWSKRQATLVLTLLADGSSAEELKPIIIFHGAGKVVSKEGRHYNPGVEVRFNKNAYNNETLFDEWITTRLASYTEGRDCLLVIDVARFHKTEKILQTLKAHNITLALIPPGLTAYLQPLDVGFNGPFKKWLQDETDLYLDRLEASGNTPAKWSVSDRRIMTTHVVANAWQRAFSASNTSLVQGLFKKTGISVHPDGREDHLISIKDIDFSQLKLDDWYRPPESDEVNTNQETVPGIAEGLDLNEATREYVSALEASRDVPRNTMTVKELQRLCRSRGLPTSGRKADLLTRLQDHEANRG